MQEAPLRAHAHLRDLLRARAARGSSSCARSRPTRPCLPKATHPRGAGGHPPGGRPRARARGRPHRRGRRRHRRKRRGRQGALRRKSAARKAQPGARCGIGSAPPFVVAPLSGAGVAQARTTPPPQTAALPRQRGRYIRQKVHTTNQGLHRLVPAPGSSQSTRRLRAEQVGHRRCRASCPTATAARKGRAAPPPGGETARTPRGRRRPSPAQSRTSATPGRRARRKTRQDPGRRGPAEDRPGFRQEPVARRQEESGQQHEEKLQRSFVRAYPTATAGRWRSARRTGRIESSIWLNCVSRCGFPSYCKPINGLRFTI